MHACAVRLASYQGHYEILEYFNTRLASTLLVLPDVIVRANLEAGQVQAAWTSNMMVVPIMDASRVIL